MNRREFLRTAIATATLLAVGATGLFEVAAKAAASQATTQQQLQLPPVTSEASQSSPSPAQSASSSSSTQSSPASSQSSFSSSQTSSGSTSSAQTTSSPIPAGYVLVATLASLSGRTSAYFTHPSQGSSILLSLNGQWKAFSAECTHRPCTVEYQSSELYCPCHGATFNASNGSVTRGPAQTGLGEFGVLEQNGNIYVSDSYVT